MSPSVGEPADTQAYAIGFSFPYNAILEMLVRTGVPCGAFARMEDAVTLKDIMWVLCDVSANNVALLESALSAMAAHDVLLITHEDMGGYPRHRKAFIAQTHLRIPEACAIRDLPRRSFHSDDMASLRRLLGIESPVDEYVMRRWDDRVIDVPKMLTSQTPSAAEVARLPIELIDQVLGHMRLADMDADDPLWWIPFDCRVARSIQDLNAAGLVCQSWLPLARRHVLAAVPLYMSLQRITAFISLLQNPTWRSFVQRLYINFPFRSEGISDPAAVGIVNALVQPLSHLRALHFDNVSAAFVGNGHYARLRLPNDLQAFGFRVIGFGKAGYMNDVPLRYVPHVSLYLPRLSKLRSLSLCGVVLSNWERNPSLTNLRKLFLHWVQPLGSGSDANDFSRFLAALTSSPLEVLALTHTVVSSKDVALLAARCRTIQSFRCSADAQPPGRVPWGVNEIAMVQEELDKPVDKRWIFPYLCGHRFTVSLSTTDATSFLRPQPQAGDHV